MEICLGIGPGTGESFGAEWWRTDQSRPGTLHVVGYSLSEQNGMEQRPQKPPDGGNLTMALGETLLWCSL